MFKVFKELEWSEPDSDDHSYIVISNGVKSITIARLTWHNPDRLDDMIDEMNKIAEKYKLDN